MSKLNDLIDSTLANGDNLNEGFREDLATFSKLVNRKEEKSQLGIPRALESLNTALDSAKVARNMIDTQNPNYRLLEASVSSIEKIIDILKSLR